MIKRITLDSLTTPDAVVVYAKAILEIAAGGLEDKVAEKLAQALSSLLFSSNQPTATYNRMMIFSSILLQRNNSWSNGGGAPNANDCDKTG